MRKFLLAFSAIIVCTFFTNIAFGQIATWDFTGQSSPATSNASTSSANLTAVPVLTRGAGAASSAASNSFRTVGFQNNGIATTNTDYFQVQLTASAGNLLSITSIDARMAGTATFAASPGVSQQFAYSLDGTTFTLIGSPSVTVGTPATLPTINTSGISALQNVPAGTTVTLRYYASGQTTTGGWGFNSPAAGQNGLAIGGTVAPPPPPTVNLSVDTNSASETGPTSVTVTATASSAVTGDQTVDLAVTGTGITAGDYTLSPTTITIPNGGTTGTATFTVVDDGAIEGSETATITMSNPSAGIILGSTTSQNVTIADNDTPLDITTANSMPNGTVGVAYTTNFSATGGTSPYTYAVTTGAVPTGLTLNSDGTWSGLPTTTGTYNFDVTVTDSNPLARMSRLFTRMLNPSSPAAPNTWTESFTITINAPTAAGSLVRGKLLTSTGRGLSNALVMLTDSTTGETRSVRSSAFGYFNFEDCATGHFYIVDVPSKKYHFNQTSFTLNGDLDDLVLTAQ